MAEFMTFAIALAITAGVLFGAFLAISFTIRREDKRGSLTIPAPSRACRNARHVAGFHRLRWESFGPGSGIATL
ncbi:MAG: hypothetical protein ACRDN0_23650 [Trebonia sp.]